MAGYPCCCPGISSSSSSASSSSGGVPCEFYLCQECPDGPGLLGVGTYTAEIPTQLSVQQTGPSVITGPCSLEIPVEVSELVPPGPPVEGQEERTYQDTVTGIYNGDQYVFTMPATKEHGTNAGWTGFPADCDTDTDCNTPGGDCGELDSGAAEPVSIPCENLPNPTIVFKDEVVI